MKISGLHTSFLLAGEVKNLFVISLFTVQKMKDVSRTNKNVVCRVHKNKLLVRFKEVGPMPQPAPQEHPSERRPRAPRYTKEERSVS